MYLWREEKNISLGQIAKEMGVSREAVRLWENGKTRTSTENIIRLAEILGVAYSDIEKHFAVESMRNRGVDEEYLQEYENS